MHRLGPTPYCVYLRTTTLRKPRSKDVVLGRENSGKAVRMRRRSEGGLRSAVCGQNRTPPSSASLASAPYQLPRKYQIASLPPATAGAAPAHPCARAIWTSCPSEGQVGAEQSLQATGGKQVRNSVRRSSHSGRRPPCRGRLCLLLSCNLRRDQSAFQHAGLVAAFGEDVRARGAAAAGVAAHDVGDLAIEGFHLHA
jgi:hypothetical protein